MSKTLRMTFQLNGTKTLSLSLADPKDGLTKADVETAMNNMIGKKALLVSGESPIGIKEIVVRSTENIELA